MRFNIIIFAFDAIVTANGRCGYYISESQCDCDKFEHFYQIDNLEPCSLNTAIYTFNACSESGIIKILENYSKIVTNRHLIFG